MSEVATRFAPSPTGRLHLGHAWSALCAHDYARTRGGHFLLRIEDIDASRARPEHVSAIIEDLLWLGLAWEGEIVFQSERQSLYALALEDLKRRGLAYPCVCSRKDIAESANAPHGPDAAVYPGTCRALSADARAQRVARDPHCWRLDMTRAVDAMGPLDWTDGDGAIHAARPGAQGDVVIARKDAPVSYHLAVTIDDAAQAISHVVRGRDLLEATHVQRLLQALLDLPTPTYIHHALVGDGAGARLAKRTGAPMLCDMRADGVDPAALIAAMRSGRFPAGYTLIA